MRYIPRILAILSLWLCYSCVTGIDTDQTEDIVLTPKTLLSLAYFDVDTSVLPYQTTQGITIEDRTDLDVFNDTFFSDNLQSAALTFLFTNSIERDFIATISFLDATDKSLHSFSIPIAKKASTALVKVQHIESFDADSISVILNTATLKIAIEVLPGKALQKNTVGNFSMQSAGNFNFKIAQ